MFRSIERCQKTQEHHSASQVTVRGVACSVTTSRPLVGVDHSFAGTALSGVSPAEGLSLATPKALEYYIVNASWSPGGSAPQERECRTRTSRWRSRSGLRHAAGARKVVRRRRRWPSARPALWSEGGCLVISTIAQLLSGCGLYSTSIHPSSPSC